VTDDRPFLVDTATARVTELGWTLRGVWHPILGVARDASGTLVGLDPAGVEESWLSIEAYPPLGPWEDGRLPALVGAVEAGLAASRLVDDDAGALRAMALRVAGLAHTWHLSAQVEGRGSEVGELLTWLTQGHFTFFGYRYYRVDQDAYRPDLPTGLGLLRHASGDEFHARLAGRDDHRLLVVTRDSRRSPLQRSGFLDYVGVREFDTAGRIVGEHRFLGVSNPGADAEPLGGVPVLGPKAARIRSLLEYDPDSHSGQVVEQTLASFPRHLLFEGDPETLAADIARAAGIQERGSAGLLLRPGCLRSVLDCPDLPAARRLPHGGARTHREGPAGAPGGRLAGVPGVGDRFPDGPADAGGEDRPGPCAPAHLDTDALQADVIAATRGWTDDFNDAAAHLPAQARGVTFGDAYQSAHEPWQGVADLLLANQLTGPDDLRFVIYRPNDPGDAADLRFKVITAQRMSLSRVMPHLDALGLDVLDERPFHWDLRGAPVSLLRLRLHAARRADADRLDAGRPRPVRRRVRGVLSGPRARRAAQPAGHQRGADLGAGRPGCGASPATCGRRASPSASLTSQTRSMPTPRSPPHWSTPSPCGSTRIAARAPTPSGVAFEGALAAIESGLDEVSSLDQDRILRLFVAVLRAMQRTNAFVPGQEALAFKLDPTELDVVAPAAARPRDLRLQPARRGRAPAVRGRGARRPALVRPPRGLPHRGAGTGQGADGEEHGDRAGGRQGRVRAAAAPRPARRPRRLAGRGAGLLPHLRGRTAQRHRQPPGRGAVVPPARVVRHDGDDTYLVVAADKGTAAFSDLANDIAVRRGFWLGDAFASGGSVGYDHKGMGITARGAWESVKRHFYEAGLDCQAHDFTVRRHR
jgi:glutamate dehydrogenase